MELPLPLILASRSPRRQQLLCEAGYAFQVHPARETAECGRCSGENAAQMVARLAYQKAADVAPLYERAVILGCDTVVECCGQILGKPVDRDDAGRMLHLLSGRDHQVISGLCLIWRPENRRLVEVAITRLRMDQIGPQQLDAYLDTEAWSGKAGAFGYQDGHDWIRVVSGSESNVVGLPLELLAEMLGRP